MTEEKTQWKEHLEAVSVLQWVLSFLFLGKFPLRSPRNNISSPVDPVVTTEPELM